MAEGEGRERPRDRWADDGPFRWAVEMVAWSLVAWGVWLVTLSAISVAELAVGGGCAVLSGVVATAVRHLVHGRWHPTPAMLVPAAALPLAVVVDSVAVLAAPWRPSRRRLASRSDASALEPVNIGAAGSSPAARARRALATVVVSASPGTVVVEADVDGCLVTHSFSSAGPSLASRFGRR